MSMRYKGSVISATPPTTSTTTATGVWTLPQQMQAQGAGNWPSGGPFNYIEDVFSTYVYAGSNSSQTITNNIDLSTYGGLVWTKARTTTYSHFLTDTIRGGNKQLSSNNTNSSDTSSPAEISSFNTNGYTLAGSTVENISGQNFVGWTFRKQPKFFDVVTYSGNSVAGRAISHNLGSAPGCVIIKVLNTSGESWIVWHRSGTQDNYTGAYLDSTSAYNNKGQSLWGPNPGTPDMNSLTFSVGNNTNNNQTGYNYIAYLFAHNAGGFGTSGNDNVITCGSYTGSNSTATTVTLGYEPQWIMIKRATGTTSVYTGWAIFDNMRGMPVSGNDNTLLANTSDAENPATANGAFVSPTATGFTLNVPGSNLTNTTETFIYIAIRRGPMKVPTVGTSVFSPNAVTSGTVTTNFPVDLQIAAYRSTYTYNSTANDRLRGVSTNATTTSSLGLITSSTNAEGGACVSSLNWSSVGTAVPGELSGVSSIYWNFRRAPGFFDEVCYTGTGSLGNTLTHNLGVTPELMIVKCRSNNPTDWTVYTSTTGNTAALILNYSVSVFSGDVNYWNNTSPTATQFTVGLYGTVNGSARTYVAYLFATCAGVSKVGSYTGTGATQTIDCGFTGGARFVLIKRSDSTGDWYVWDTARGMVSGTDPSLLLNTTAAEVNANSVYTTGVGFQIVSTAAGINASGGTYIFLAVS